MSAAQPAPVDLAPSNPYSLIIQGPVIVAPGCDYRDLDRTAVGAIATRMTTRHTRAEPPPRFAATPAGLLVASLPSISIRTLLKEESRRWERSSTPVLVALLGDTVELAEMALMLEGVEGVAGLLISAEDDLVAAVTACRRETHRAILATFPFGGDLHQTAVDVVAAGADALVVMEAPLGASAGADSFEGYLLGPAIFPLALRAIAGVRAAVSVPIVALGGIATPELARDALRVGAAAVMIDGARWGDPEGPARIARALREPAAAGGEAT